jgi:predicted ATPase
LALNAPETSLHPDLIAPLAELVIDASTRSQVWVTTHAEALASAIAAKSDVAPIRLAKREGATVIERMAEPDDDE